MFSKQGITLISLVITIVVLLILAGVAISVATNGNGIFTKANEAVGKWNNKVAEENRLFDNILALWNEYGGNDGGKPTLPDSWNSNIVVDTVIEGNRMAPIPAGFVASKVTGENTISDGLVIYETNLEVNKTNHDIALTNYNQYVWIPVDNINDMLMCQIHGGSVRLDTTTLQCVTCGAKTKLAGKLYAGEFSETIEGSNTFYNCKIDFTKNDQTFSENSGLREPDILTGNSIASGREMDGAGNNYHGLGTSEAFLKQLQSDFDNMAKSVAKYKGFYISRYEVGENATSKKQQPVLSSGHDSGNMWYGLYKITRKTGTSTTSQMIWRK